MPDRYFKQSMVSSLDSRVYVGNLPPDVREKDVKDLFWKFGPIKQVTLKNQRGPPFAFVEFDDYRDAEDAVKGRSGYNFDGYKLRVERPKSNSITGANSRLQHPPSVQGIRNNITSKRTKHRVNVSGLPISGSWQDLKDHMREAGDVCFADVFENGNGVVEFLSKDDARYAVRYLDDTKFKSHEGETSYIRVEADEERSRSRSPRRSPSYSSSDRSRSYSRSPSPRNAKSR